jgi:hypothetical protein
MILLQHRLRVEGVHLGWTSVQKQIDDSLRLRRKMGLLHRERIRGRRRSQSALHTHHAEARANARK